MGPTRQVSQLKQELESITAGSQLCRGSLGGRGRNAARPTDIPPSGWLDVLWRAWGEISEANLFLVAGGVTYAVLLALFPAIAAGVSLYGLVADPSQVERQLSALNGLLPEQAMQMLSDELHTLVTASGGVLGISAGIGLLIALWSASRGMSGMITALNIAYEQKETRGFFKLNLIALLLTIALMVGGLVVITLIAVLPTVVQLLAVGNAAKWLVLILEWPLLIAVMLGGLAVLYRYAPARAKAKWKWVSPGALSAAVLWVVASLGFTLYVANFNSYNKTYGSLGGVVILLTWLYISALVVLLGAVVNAQSEKQTTRDSTAGPAQPMGVRGAFAADTLGATRQ
jgi:membrane protein